MRAGTLFVLLSLAVAACTGPTPYRAAAGPDDDGYSDQQIDGRTWRVQFAGNTRTSREIVENAILYRAAELARANGADGFVVLREDVERQVRYVETVPAYGYAYPGFHRPFHHSRPYFGFAPYYAASAYPITTYKAYATVRLYRGRPPTGQGTAYDAGEILTRIGPSLPRPAPPQS